ncbi:FkbM family methyltransferase [Krasilnikoviella flava]|uniref:Methyltransferase, FkbM family n=1 Tax=Krasilnikoviella flava TaxID=526729 RepID=A0A1T5IAH9_9MICO|nr:FkbM family methyltransferase [Krasilnikoviella flava]SKC36161.1 methyltransferase, FkbM family [Krasilnikoviella flava]
MGGTARTTPDDGSRVRRTLLRWADRLAGDELRELVDRRVRRALDERAAAPSAPSAAPAERGTPPARGTRQTLAAHAARPWLSAGRSIPTRVQSPELRALRRAHPYTGPVLVQAGVSRPAWMWFDEDDLVAAVAFWFGPNAYESLSTAVFSVLAARAGHVLDVGAHTGVFSLVAGASSPDVVVDAFEVMDRIARRAETNVRISGLADRVHVHATGVSSEPGTLTLHHNGAARLATGSSFEQIAERQAARGATTSEVEVTTLDAWWGEQGRPGVDLVKLDVERHESHVIAGARGLLAAEQPVLLAEVLSREDFATLYGLLGESGYARAWSVDDDAGLAYPVRPDLTYATGADYVYTRYHNVLFAGERRAPAVAAALAGLDVAADAPAQVVRDAPR